VVQTSLLAMLSTFPLEAAHIWRLEGMNIAGYDILTIRGRFKKIKVFRKRLWQH
jgi:hypothetical protein